MKQETLLPQELKKIGFTLNDTFGDLRQYLCELPTCNVVVELKKDSFKVLIYDTALYYDVSLSNINTLEQITNIVNALK